MGQAPVGSLVEHAVAQLGTRHQHMHRDAAVLSDHAGKSYALRDQGSWCEGCNKHCAGHFNHFKVQ